MIPAVLECKELHKVQLLGKQDPYVSISLGIKQTYSTKSTARPAMCFSAELCSLRRRARQPAMDRREAHVVLATVGAVFEVCWCSNKPVEKGKKEEAVQNDPSFII